MLDIKDIYKETGWRVKEIEPAKKSLFELAGI